jgi:hypothetical protein
MRLLSGLLLALGLLVCAPAAEAYIYWANSNATIGRANTDGSGASGTFITGAGNPVDVAVNDGYVWWSNLGTNSFGRANLDGSGVEVGNASSATPHGIALSDRKVYQTFVSENTITSGEFGDSPATLSIGASAPKGIAGTRDHLYWANAGTGTIGRSTPSGGLVNTAFVSGAEDPDGVAVDRSHIYWANSSHDAIGRANLDGTGVDARFITGAGTPRGIAIHAGYLYWTRALDNSIARARLDGTGLEPNFITGAAVSNPRGIAIDDRPIPTPAPPAVNVAGISGWAPVGAVGPNHYVQANESAVRVYGKNGVALTDVNVFSGYTPTNADSNCGAGRNARIRYDRRSDRWIVVRLSESSILNQDGGPSYACVAVSKTADPAGEYWRYDFAVDSVRAVPRDLAVWGDAYFATYSREGAPFNGNDIGTPAGGRVCAWERSKMLAGEPAGQQCWTTPVSDGVPLPASPESSIPPPADAEEALVSFRADDTALNVWHAHVDWLAPAASTLDGPTALGVTPFVPSCCVMHPKAYDQFCTSHCVAAQYRVFGDLPMSLTYRNFGDHESVIFNHTVDSGWETAVRWYELDVTGGAASVHQEGTYAPVDGRSRFGAGMAQDRAGNLLAGFYISGAFTPTSLGYSERSPSDPAGTFGIGEAMLLPTSGQSPSALWGDRTSISVDPSDDCTFWYTALVEAAPSTRILSFKVPTCGDADFALAPQHDALTVAAGSSTSTPLTATTTQGGDEPVSLSAVAPSGVTAVVTPATVQSAAAGATTALMLSPDASLTPGEYVVTVNAHQAPSGAYRTASVTLTVTAPVVAPLDPPTPSPTGGATPTPGPGSPSATATPAPTPTPGAARCIVPRLKKLTRAAAKKKLVTAGCRLGSVKVPRKLRKATRLVVSRQSPAAGNRVPVGTKVTLTLARRKHAR